MKSSLRLTRIAGIDIGIHYSWIFIFVLLAVSLAVALFPGQYPGWDTMTYWITGIVTVTDVKELPQDKWEETPVREIMSREPLHRISPEDDLNTALRLITKHDVNQVLVTEGTRCAGIVNRADILSYLQLSQELGLEGNPG